MSFPIQSLIARFELPNNLPPVISNLFQPNVINFLQGNTHDTLLMATINSNMNSITSSTQMSNTDSLPFYLRKPNSNSKENDSSTKLFDSSVDPYFKTSNNDPIIEANVNSNSSETSSYPIIDSTQFDELFLRECLYKDNITEGSHPKCRERLDTESIDLNLTRPTAVAKQNQHISQYFSATRSLDVIPNTLYNNPEREETSANTNTSDNTSPTVNPHLSQYFKNTRTIYFPRAPSNTSQPINTMPPHSYPQENLPDLPIPPLVTANSSSSTRKRTIDYQYYILLMLQIIIKLMPLFLALIANSIEPNMSYSSSNTLHTNADLTDYSDTSPPTNFSECRDENPSIPTSASNSSIFNLFNASLENSTPSNFTDCCLDFTAANDFAAGTPGTSFAAVATLSLFALLIKATQMLRY